VPHLNPSEEPSTFKPLSSEAAQHLLEEARLASQNAYAPYSAFPVGAALLLEDGRVLQGCNVENASYGLTVCAERNALALRVMQGLNPIPIRAIAVYAERTPGHYITPCGACRQVISEFATPETVVLWYTHEGEMEQVAASALLPHAFILQA
jgi:cytidine deaminase